MEVDDHDRDWVGDLRRSLGILSRQIRKDHRKFRPISGILLQGPPGCGKTKLALAIATETHIPFHKISPVSEVSSIYLNSEQNCPSIIFIDGIDTILETQQQILIEFMDANFESFRNSSEFDQQCYVLIIGATDIPHAIDRALKKPGLLAYKIKLGVLDENARRQYARAFIECITEYPSIIFIDGIDAILETRQQILTEFIDANFESFQNSSEVDQQGCVLVIGVTNIPYVIDHVLKKPGLLTYKIKLGVPNENARFEILSILITTKRLGDCCNHYKKHRLYRRIKNNASEKVCFADA
ncbi:ATPase, AAA-type, core [Trema orientale]|uniref:ATPase, AAA-type, core n=1 Tax=Trema orientale TaxID=63057 RepID=A0A2P5D993_TREOI|nr:ATPase, AAA-type, core [Trema orientale]